MSECVRSTCCGLAWTWRTEGFSEWPTEFWHFSHSDSDIILTTLWRTMVWYTGEDNDHASRPYYRGTEFLESQINPIVIFFFTSLIRLSCARRKWKLACCDQIPDFYLDQVFTRNNKLQQWPPGLSEWRGQSGERGLGTNFSLSCPTINSRRATSEHPQV